MATPDEMTFSQCLGILDRFKNWNTGQTSVSLAFGGARTAEDDLYDAQRELLKAVNLRLLQMATTVTHPND